MEYVWIVLGFLCNLICLVAGSYTLIKMVTHPEKYAKEGKVFYIVITIINLLAIILWVSSFVIKLTIK